MDVASSSASLFYQVFRLYRHISSARSFSDSADYQAVEETVLRILSEVYMCLEKLNKLRGKYGLDLTSSGPSPSPAAASAAASPPPASTGVPSLDPLFSSSRVSAALSRNAAARQERSRAVSFFRKVNFSWSISDDMSDRVKIEETLKTLRDLNDRLESILPPSSSRADNNGADLTRRVVSLKMLSVTAEPTELRAIGEITATQAGRGAGLYQQIYNAATLKAMRLEGGVSQPELQSVVLEEKMLVASPHTPNTQRKHKHTRTLCKLQTGGSTSTVLVEGIQFPDSLPDADIQLLHQRIATLAVLLKLAGQPYFRTLPSCHGYIRYSHTQFGLVYSLPESADLNREPVSLYSLLPTTGQPGLALFGTEKRASRSTLPTLEERYRLAHAIADAVLSLLSVSWVHKSLCSWNVLLFRSSQGGSANKIDFARPMITGFGVSRREKQCEVTVDTRDRDSPLGLWQHPDLRGSAHVRFQPKHDVYALGLVLFEIAMWQDLRDFDRREDLLAHVLSYSAVVAHRMGTTYRDAMMACLEDEFRWDETGVQGREGGMALVFADEVVARLLLCVEGV
ncbi:hypothetical protein RB595_001666 [Gaeumannomyces hyphopodioides]